MIIHDLQFSIEGRKKFVTVTLNEYNDRGDFIKIVFNEDDMRALVKHFFRHFVKLF